MLLKIRFSMRFKWLTMCEIYLGDALSKKTQGFFTKIIEVMDCDDSQRFKNF